MNGGAMYMKVGLLLLGVLGTSARASLPRTEPVPVASFSATKDLGIKMRNAEAGEIIARMVADESFWADAWTKDYPDKWYDEIRLKSMDSGYLPMITGEGDQDYDAEIVSHVIFNKMHQLPQYMSGAKAVVNLGKGHDPTIGADYSDTFWFLDMTVMYVVYPMRMYRREDPESGSTYLWFEKLDASFVDAATWATYQQKIESCKGAQSLRWAPFNSVNEAETLYGIFMVQPGKTRTSRVTFVSKLAFGSGTGWVARFGSELPGVLKAGLRSGFVASVNIAKAETERRTKAGG